MRILELFKPFRIIAARRVSEEETVTVEAFCSNQAQTKERLDIILASFRDHRKRHNEEVVKAAQAQVTALETILKNRQDELAGIDEQIEKRKKHPLLRVG